MTNVSFPSNSLLAGSSILSANVLSAAIFVKSLRKSFITLSDCEFSYFLRHEPVYAIIQIARIRRITAYTASPVQ